MFFSKYNKIVLELINKVYDDQGETIEEAGRMLADTIENDGLLHVFGCGHSHMIIEELFYRAGGLIAVSPIFETSTMLHEGAAKSSQIERMSGYAPLVLERYPVKEGDCLLIVSSSGINSFPIEMAQAAKKKGAKILGISSMEYRSRESRQKDGLYLSDVCDVCVDNNVPVGDAAVTVRSDGTKAGPVSTILSMYIANSIVICACEHLRDRGIEPEIFMSGNCANGDEYNEASIAKMIGKIKHL